MNISLINDVRLFHLVENGQKIVQTESFMYTHKPTENHKRTFHLIIYFAQEHTNISENISTNTPVGLQYFSIT